MNMCKRVRSEDCRKQNILQCSLCICQTYSVSPNKERVMGLFTRKIGGEAAFGEKLICLVRL